MHSPAHFCLPLLHLLDCSASYCFLSVREVFFKITSLALFRCGEFASTSYVRACRYVCWRDFAANVVLSLPGEDAAAESCRGKVRRRVCKHRPSASLALPATLTANAVLILPGEAPHGASVQKKPAANVVFFPAAAKNSGEFASSKRGPQGFRP